MKVAVLADVHANLHALEAVLSDAERAGCEAVWHLGDYLGYAACPNEVVSLVGESPGDCIIGNYDSRALRIGGPRTDWPSPTIPAKRFSFRWAYEQLSPANRRLLASLPPVRRKRVSGARFLLTHAGGQTDSQIIDANTPHSKLAELAARAGADVVLFGHTHQPFDRTVNGVRLFNPGAVGRSEDGDPRASYAVFTIGENQLAVQRRRVEYDVESAVRAVEEQHLPEGFSQMLIRGKRLEAVVAEMSRRPGRRQEWRPGRDRLCMAAADLAERMAQDLEHSRHVTHLALRLFDALTACHCLGPPTRRLLHCAGLLHDIGWVRGRRKHHKNAMKMIMEADELPLDDRSRRVVALTARYHRRALPRWYSHELLATLSAGDKYRLLMLGGILRVADGLDATHCKRVVDVEPEVRKSCVSIKARTSGQADEEISAANKKSDMLARAFAREVKVTANGRGG